MACRIPLAARVLSAFGAGLIRCAAADGGDLTDLSFEELTSMQVTTASKFIQSTRDAPSAVQVILREDIRRYGWRTLAEALNSLPGLYSVSDRGYDFLGARGFLVPGDYSTRFLLLIDGQRVNDNIYQQATLGTEFPLDLALVERIEYVPGPGSSIYGSNAFFGVINVITRRAEALPPFSVSVLASGDGWFGTQATTALHSESGASLMASVTAANKTGRDETYADPAGNLVRADGTPATDGVAHELDRQQIRYLFTRYENAGFSLTGRFGQRREQPSSALYDTIFDDPDLSLKDQNWSLLARYEGRLSETLGYEARLEYAQSVYVANYPYLDELGNRYINRDDSLGKWWQGEFRLHYLGLASHKLVAGIELQQDAIARQRNFDVDANVHRPVSRDSPDLHSGIYAQDEWAFAERWRLNAGLRFDRDTSGYSMFSPRLGLIWLASTAHTIKLLAGRAYRLPNAYERDFSNGLDYLANPDLKPESITTQELVYEQRFDHEHVLSVSAFNYRIAHPISQVVASDGALQYQNQADVRAHGVEAAWQTRRLSGVEFAASIATSYLDGTNTTGLSYTPRWIGKLRGSLPLFERRWRISAEVSALSKVDYRWRGEDRHLPARYLANLTLSSEQLGPGLDGYLRIINLFDRRYDLPASGEVPVPAIPGTRRTWEIGLRYAF